MLYSPAGRETDFPVLETFNSLTTLIPEVMRTRRSSFVSLISLRSVDKLQYNERRHEDNRECECHSHGGLAIGGRRSFVGASEATASGNGMAAGCCT